MFTDRWRKALDTVNASAADIARHMNCDRSYITRIAKGVRTPKMNGTSAWKLVRSVYACADENGCVGELCALLRTDDADTAEHIMQALMLWLYEGERELTDISRFNSLTKEVPFRSFGQRLNSVMTLVGLSNIRMGKLLSVDPSYISRFRSGFRSPKSNSKLMNRICSILLDSVFEQQKSVELAMLLKQPVKALKDREQAHRFLYHWLYDTEKDDSPSVESLIERIGAFSADIRMPPFSLKETAEAIPSDRATVYYKTEGLQRAVLRFLLFVAGTKKKEIFLYSDQNMDWMTSNPIFAAKWLALMVSCVQNGTVINIIHNIDRGLDEMTQAIQSWLPLYPSGRIRSYYCTRSCDTRFSTTLFLCPGSACISGHNAKGNEDRHGIYRYDTEPQILLMQKHNYDDLLSDSAELVKGFRINQLDPAALSVTDMTVISDRLSLATMPHKTLKSLLSRHKITGDIKEKAFTMWKQQRDFYMHCLEKYKIHECVPISFDDTVIADIPGLTLSYTEQEYAEHIENLIGLSEKYIGYRLFMLPMPVFENVRVRIWQNGVTVSRTCPPQYTFYFEHPYMCGAFFSYAEKIKERYSLDKLTTKNRLQKYLK